MNALTVHKPKARVAVLAETPDADDARDMEWDVYVQLRELHRESLGRKYSAAPRKERKNEKV